jgi:hypothetical protein
MPKVIIQSRSERAGHTPTRPLDLTLYLCICWLSFRNPLLALSLSLSRVLELDFSTFNAHRSNALHILSNIYQWEK